MAGVALASVAVLSRLAVRTAYVGLETEARAARLSGLASVLSETLPRGDAPTDALLAEAASSLGVRLLLVGPDGRVRGASSPELRNARVEVRGERLSLEETEQVNGMARSRKTVLLGSPRVQVRSAGSVSSTLFALPPPRDDGEAGEPRSLAARVAGAGKDEIGALGRAFNSMADALARTEGLRRTLVTDVAHELRTPLTNLRCQIEALQDGLQPADPQALASLHEETVLLARLVDDLQDLALAESGHLPLRMMPVSVGEAVSSALVAMRPRAVERGIALAAEVASGLLVQADRERLGQVLRNLLDNAVTHTPAGGAITVTGAREGRLVRLSVADSGQGIAAEHLPHVFDRFYRADPSRARATGGAGLGLAIVKQLVEAQGGTVAVVSAPGQGTRFTITLAASPA